MVIGLLILFSCFIISCNSEPGDEEIKDRISMHYMGMSMAAVGGSWHPSEISVLKKELEKGSKNAWKITAETKGTYESPPLGNPVPDEEFCDTLNFLFQENKEGFWECRLAN